MLLAVVMFARASVAPSFTSGLSLLSRLINGGIPSGIKWNRYCHSGNGYIKFHLLHPFSWYLYKIRITSHSGQNVGLGEGWVGSFPETYNNPKRPLSQLCFGVIDGEFSTLEPSKTNLKSPQLPLSRQTICNICYIVSPAHFFDPSLEYHPKTLNAIQGKPHRNVNALTK